MRRGHSLTQSYGRLPHPATASDDGEPSFRELRRQFIPCPKGLHRATYRRLLRLRLRALKQLEGVPFRRTWPIVRKRLRSEFTNTLHRINRRLGVRVSRPPTRRWYRTGEAAAFLGVSSKTLLRWTARGRITAERSPWGKRQRRYRHVDLVRLVQGGERRPSLPAIYKARH